MFAFGAPRPPVTRLNLPERHAARQRDTNKSAKSVPVKNTEYPIRTNLRKMLIVNIISVIDS